MLIHHISVLIINNNLLTALYTRNRCKIKYSNNKICLSWKKKNTIHIYTFRYRVND